VSRICVYLSEKAVSLLPELLEKSGKERSAYINDLIIAAAENQIENLAGMRDDLEHMKWAVQANTKNTSALLDMLNSYLMTFENGTDASSFSDAIKKPHVWTMKAMENVEARLRMARYKKTDKKEV